MFSHIPFIGCSFENFNNFIKDRKLGAFVDKDENGKFIAKKWINTENFNEDYFNELLSRVKKYKNI